MSWTEVEWNEEGWIWKAYCGIWKIFHLTVCKRRLDGCSLDYLSARRCYSLHINLPAEVVKQILISLFNDFWMTYVIENITSPEELRKQQKGQLKLKYGFVVSRETHQQWQSAGVFRRLLAIRQRGGADTLHWQWGRDDKVLLIRNGDRGSHEGRLASCLPHKQTPHTYTRWKREFIHYAVLCKQWTDCIETVRKILH